METVADKGAALGQGATKTYRIRENLKRYWQTEIWGELFSLLLNPLQHLQAEEAKKMPVLKGMRACRERMEGWLEENWNENGRARGEVVEVRNGTGMDWKAIYEWRCDASSRCVPFVKQKCVMGEMPSASIWIFWRPVYPRGCFKLSRCE
ncbi:hypothetical protein KC345_g219 [Hortaea werneckii]|nr:hypothetical protein KC345_g219 [Hortaea werneckii]